MRVNVLMNSRKRPRSRSSLYIAFLGLLFFSYQSDAQTATTSRPATGQNPSGQNVNGGGTHREPEPPPKEVAGIPANYDESAVGAYTLPDPLVLSDGKPVRNAKTWFNQRRPEIVHLFEEDQFGRSPGRPADMSFDVFDKGTPAFDGKATRRQITIYFSANKSGPKLDLLVYVPAEAKKPVPVLLNISFTANSNTVDDPGVKAGEVWGPDKKKIPAKQGRVFGRLDVPRLIDKGYGVATFYYGDVDPDFLGGLPYGVRAMYLKPGQAEPAPDDWGSIAAWAWGLSRALDYLETDKAVDATRVGLDGHLPSWKNSALGGSQRHTLSNGDC